MFAQKAWLRSTCRQGPKFQKESDGRWRLFTAPSGPSRQSSAHICTRAPVLIFWAYAHLFSNLRGTKAFSPHYLLCYQGEEKRNVEETFYDVLETVLPSWHCFSRNRSKPEPIRVWVRPHQHLTGRVPTPRPQGNSALDDRGRDWPRRPLLVPSL